MNLVHRWLCSSARWKNVVETYILPWTLDDVNLGSDLLEIGPMLRNFSVQHSSRGDLVMLDNLHCHKVAGVREAITATGATIEICRHTDPIGQRVQQLRRVRIPEQSQRLTLVAMARLRASV